ncbi:hypothetical protein FCM35_KLT18229 [Carex littledalei]|uniref:Uncharacterized protein n=1 Tax=Carex littledalei TaxID=544730 RepID=A0A833REW9_9POAL|nr:hypothetical protein FCM35_KLT18229 [Carex littledalei]
MDRAEGELHPVVGKQALLHNEWLMGLIFAKPLEMCYHELGAWRCDSIPLQEWYPAEEQLVVTDGAFDEAGEEGTQ